MLDIYYLVYHPPLLKYLNLYLHLLLNNIIHFKLIVVRILARYLYRFFRPFYLTYIHFNRNTINNFVHILAILPKLFIQYYQHLNFIIRIC
jgi:hypothetical protein